MADDSLFAPAVVDAMVPAVAVGHERKTARRNAKPDVGASRSKPKASLSGSADLHQIGEDKSELLDSARDGSVRVLED